MRLGSTIKFTLTFEEIPDDVTKFNLIEGNQEKKRNFYDIQLIEKEK